ncbi:ABC transporter ATP-binding protein [Devosia sp. 2618]|uniref:ABC transporter ATP-binding protein n=1 Tax=Devosia sp. 2618 TaxID=3156454 RepID=UPI003394ABDC
MADEPILAIRDLTVAFGAKAERALNGVSFDLKRGEVLALVGESGSGKSATALAVLGLLPHVAKVSGTVHYDGTDLISARRDKLFAMRGSGIAIVFQDPVAALDPVFTIGYQLAETIKVHQPDLSASEVRQRAISLLAQVEIADPERRLSSHPHEMSGGQLQRVMIAIALAGNPDIIIADEPTTALDVTVQREVLNLLRRLNQELSTAILLITHDMGVVADLADQVIVLRHGRIVETAPVLELFESPKHDYTRSLLAAVPKRDADHVAPQLEGEPWVSVQDLHIAYRTGFRQSADIVRDVSFDIRPGEILGLVGESGSGKSSIGKSLIGLAPVTYGRILIEGQDVSQARRHTRELRSRIGVVFQSPSGSLNPRLTLGDVIAEPFRAHRRLASADLAKAVDRLLDQVGLPSSWRSRYPHELSGGQKQRVAIARAIALRPALLIADEPTPALDVSVQADILKLLKDLQAESNFACLFISHDLLVVQNLCNRVIVLRHGQIVESGPTNAVLGTPQDDYTRTLVLSAPIADPRRQAERRALG